MKIIAKIHTDMPDKFGVPRQSGVVEELAGRIVFEPEYRMKEAFDGLEEFSYIWIIWKFSKTADAGWSPAVRPPRLGGEKRKGVFATRSPFRPNPIGLSCVKLEKIEHNQALGTVLHVRGADLVDGTPIYDIKPYITYADSHPEAKQGFAENVKDYSVEVDFPSKLLALIPNDKRAAVIKILEQDPRPAYHDFPDRIYGVKFAGFDVKFKVDNQVLTVVGVEKY